MSQKHSAIDSWNNKWIWNDGKIFKITNETSMALFRVYVGFRRHIVYSLVVLLWCLGCWWWYVNCSRLLRVLIHTVLCDVGDAPLDGWGHCVTGCVRRGEWRLALARSRSGWDSLLQESIPAGAATLFHKLHCDCPVKWGKGPLETPHDYSPLEVHHRKSHDLFSLDGNDCDNYATICGSRTNLSPRTISIVLSVELRSAEKGKGH